jgi:hypothetical protein
MSAVAKMAVAVALVAMGASGAKAAGIDLSGAKQMDQAAIERSWALQAELARIEANKEAFVDELLASWVPYVDGNEYDVVAELKPIAMKAFPWRLYGASLVGDYRTMVQLLRGKVGAAQYINTLDKPEPKVRVDTKVLGGTIDSLVFTPIAPCRIVDTRGTGARTGIMNPGVSRVFDLTTGGFSKGQGGDTVCPGLPAFSHFGWSANVTATGHTAIGGLQAWGFTGPIPSTSLLNFFPAGFAIANAGSLTGCFGCADDVVISTFGGAAHVIIDVTGFYEQATGFATTDTVGNPVVTELAGTLTTIAANSTTFVNGAACPAGTVLVSGGQSNSASGVNAVLTSDHHKSGTLWTEFLRNPNTAATATATVFTYCIDVI